MLNIEKSNELLPLSMYLSVSKFFYLMMLNYLTLLNEGKLFNRKGIIWCFALAIAADTGPVAKASRWASGQVVQYERKARPQATPFLNSKVKS